MCLVCAQSKTDMGIVRNAVDKTTMLTYDRPLSDIAYRDGKGFWRCFEKHSVSFERNLGFCEFLRR